MLRQSFFSRWKDKLAFDYGGRYFGAVLAEVLTHEPRLARILFPDLSGKSPSECEPTCEWSFPGTGGKRRADLALLSTSSREPLALAEIKYEDEKSDTNVDQIGEYLRYSRIHKVPFLYLTKSAPKDEHLRSIRKSLTAQHLLWAQLYRKLTAIKKPHALTTMLCEYLREEVPMWKEQIDKNALIVLLKNCIGLAHASGQGVRTDRATMIAATETLSDLAHNVIMLSNEFLSQIGQPCWSFARQANVNFYVDHYHHCEKLKRVVGSIEPDEYLCCGRWQRSKPCGGRLTVFGQWTVKTDEGRIWLGPCLDVEIDGSDDPFIDIGFELSCEKKPRHYEYVKRRAKTLTEGKRQGLRLEDADALVVKCAWEVLKETQKKGRTDRKSMTRPQYDKVCWLSNKLKNVKLSAV